MASLVRIACGVELPSAPSETHLSGVNYFFALTTTISPYQRQLLCNSAARGEAPPPAVLFGAKER
jgi:hypothetical protein